MSCCSSCSCDSTSTSVQGCCSIHGAVPAGLGVRWELTGAAGAASGLEIPVYQADGGVTALTITSTERLWVAWLQVLVTDGSISFVYRGTDVGDHTNLNANMAGGPLSDLGGFFTNMPFVRLGLGERLFFKNAVTTTFRVVGYGIREST